MNNVQNEPATRLMQIKPVLSSPLVVPIANTEQIMTAWRNFNELKLKLLDDSDFVDIQGEKYGKKSAFRKLALAFGISTEIIREERVELKQGYAYEITMKASAPSGRFMTAVASCHSNERRFNKDSDVRAIAQTRATNRAIADLIGWSAPSAEEMMSEMPAEDHAPAPTLASVATPQNWFQEIATNPAYRPVRTDEQNANRLLTTKQRTLLESLINERIIDPGEREDQLQMIVGLTKAEAHQLIDEMLNSKYN